MGRAAGRRALPAVGEGFAALIGAVSACAWKTGPLVEAVRDLIEEIGYRDEIGAAVPGRQRAADPLGGGRGGGQRRGRLRSAGEAADARPDSCRTSPYRQRATRTRNRNSSATPWP